MNSTVRINFLMASLLCFVFRIALDTIQFRKQKVQTKNSSAVAEEAFESAPQLQGERYLFQPLETRMGSQERTNGTNRNDVAEHRKAGIHDANEAASLIVNTSAGGTFGNTAAKNNGVVSSIPVADVALDKAVWMNSKRSTNYVHRVPGSKIVIRTEHNLGGKMIRYLEQGKVDSGKNSHYTGHRFLG